MTTFFLYNQSMIDSIARLLNLPASTDIIEVGHILDKNINSNKNKFRGYGIPLLRAMINITNLNTQPLEKTLMANWEPVIKIIKTH